jgi:hypothetical protein
MAPCRGDGNLYGGVWLSTCPDAQRPSWIGVIGIQGSDERRIEYPEHSTRDHQKLSFAKIPLAGEGLSGRTFQAPEIDAITSITENKAFLSALGCSLLAP